MNKFTLLLLCLLLLVASPFAARAGFLVHKQVAPAQPVVVAHRSPAHGITLRRPHSYLPVFHRKAQDTAAHDSQHSKMPRTGWKGITSICCSGAGYLSLVLIFVGGGLLTLIPFVLFAGGIVFGSMGLSDKNKYNGYAIAGLVLGVSGFALAGFATFLVWAFRDFTPFPGLI